jgi:hypothetical protein
MVYSSPEEEAYSPVEVATRVTPEDVPRTAKRAHALRRLGPVVVAVVGGCEITPDAFARVSGVWQMVDGGATAPSGG